MKRISKNNETSHKRLEFHEIYEELLSLNVNPSSKNKTLVKYKQFVEFVKNPEEREFVKSQNKKILKI